MKVIGNVSGVGGRVTAATPAVVGCGNAGGAVKRVLYRGLMRLGMEYDKYPLLKVFYKDKDTRYVPTKSFTQEIRKAFRSPSNKGGTLMNGFRTYNYLNVLLHEANVKIPWYNLHPSSSMNKHYNIDPNQHLLPSLTNEIKVGNILIAHPTMPKPWNQSVILILKHTETETTGVVLDCKDPCNRNGGPLPIPRNEHLVLHTNQALPNAISVTSDIYFSQVKNLDVLQNVKANHYRVFASMCRWAPRQLQEELDQGEWFLVECPQEILFDCKKREELVGSSAESVASVTAVEPAAVGDSASDQGRRLPVRHSHVTEQEETLTEQEFEENYSNNRSSVVTAGPIEDGKGIVEFESASNELWKKVLHLMGGEYAVFTNVEKRTLSDK